MQIVENKVLVVDTLEPALITGLLRKSKQTAPTQVAVHWGLHEARTLAGLGIDAPSPMLRDYVWPGRLPPFEHQKTTSSFLSVRDKAFCFSEAGVGKTRSAVAAADYLMNLGEVSRVLVVCPLSIMRAAWQQDLFKFAMHRSCGIAHGTPAARLKIIQSDVEFVIINFDGLVTVKKELLAAAFNLVIVDEASYVKTATTNRWKAMRDITNQVPRLWMMTGTPAAQSPLDAYGLAKLVCPQHTPKYFGQYRDQVMNKVSQFIWKPRADAGATVHKLLQPAIRFERKDCLDLPDVTHVERDAPLTRQQELYYERLKRDMTMSAAGDTITSVNAAVAIQKLLQLSSGCVYSEEGGVIEFDVSNRITAVLEVIDEAPHKVLVFVPFTHTIELLEDRFKREGISCARLDGSIGLNQRSQSIRSFQEEADPRVLLIQPQAASHGLTLTAADTIIWYAPVTSVETYLQANARINRPGQKHPMTVVHIQGSPVEKHLYQMLRTNIANHEKIVDLYRREVLDKV